MGKKKLDVNSNAYRARMEYESMKLVDAWARGEEASADAYRALWRASEKDGVDPVHVAQFLSSMVLKTIKSNPEWRAILDRTLEQTRLIAAAEIPDVD